MKTAFFFTELGAAQQRQYIDAEAAFRAWEAARQEAAEVRGSMVWKTQRGRRYLIRVSSSGAQKSLGPDSPDNEAIYRRFVARKEETGQCLRALRERLAEHQRVNRALRVGRTPPIVVETLAALRDAGIDHHFRVVGMHAIYAYETAAGLRVQPEATATQDIDPLFDTRGRLRFFSQLKRIDSSFLAVLRRADKTFKTSATDRYSAVNKDAFAVDVIRRTAIEDDPHPLRMSEDEDDLWAVQVSTGQGLLDGGRFSQIVVATNGAMARMETVSPASFVRVKRKLARSPSRDPLKRGKDRLQADVVEELLRAYLVAEPGTIGP